MSVLLQESETPLFKNRCFRLVVSSPVNLEIGQWTVEFHRETVKYINDVPVAQFVTPTIISSIENLNNTVYTREDGTTFTAAQVLNDVKIIADTVYTNQ
jgi:hypothetical protein